MSPCLDPIEALAALDAAGRGIGALVVPGEMAAAAVRLLVARRVVLVTGFVPRPAGRAETDGPSGTVVLGRALRRLGAEVRYLADPPVVPLLDACLRVVGEPRDILTVPAESGRAVAEARQAVAAFAPTHLVAVERPGRAADGDYYNARGASVRAYNAPLDVLFLPESNGSRRPGLVTVGVGDGGNEIGMGRVRARVARDVPHGPRIGSVVRTDYLIVGGTSNWGAWGLTAHLGLAAGCDLLHTTGEEARLTRAMIRAGGVDGLSGLAAPSVDNLPVAVHQTLLTTLRVLTAHLAACRGGDGGAGGARPDHELSRSAATRPGARRTSRKEESA